LRLPFNYLEKDICFFKSPYEFSGVIFKAKYYGVVEDAAPIIRDTLQIHNEKHHIEEGEFGVRINVASFGDRDINEEV